MMENWNLVESGILVWIEEMLRNPIMDPIMVFFSWINNSGMWAIVLTALLLIEKKYRDVGLAALTSLGLEFIAVNIVLKPWIHRIRPYDVNDALHVLGEIPTDFSFPSGHTGAAFAVTFVIMLCMPRAWGITATAVASVIAFSRLYNGVHYPTDVAGALVVALITAIFASKVVYPRAKMWLQKEKQPNENGTI